MKSDKELSKEHRHLSDKTVKPEAAAPPAKWSKWWVLMWAGITVSLLAAAPFMYVWDWWTTVFFAFGIPEFIGARVANDAFPPLTHVIVRYVHPEVSVPFMVGMSGAMGAHWLDRGHVPETGALFVIASWFLVHFLLRYIPYRQP